MNPTPSKRILLDSSPHKKKKFIKYEEASKENAQPLVNLGHQNLSESNHEYTSFTPKKINKVEEPVTPSTNFKLLTSLAATLDYANCSTPKSSKIYKDDITCDSNLSDLSCKVNRKEKSLAIICTRFLSMYPINPPLDANVIVSLDEVCLKLGIERRRLYDIVNIFESIDLIMKSAKNQYKWFGKSNLTQSLKKLRAAAFQERIPEKLQYVINAESISLRKQSCIFTEVQNFQSSKGPAALLPVTPLPDLRKEKSLGIMSQKFLMLFLVSPDKVISLGVAAKVLNGFLQRTEKSTQIKTQIRRLYDIANVLSSIRLIQKVAVSQYGKKPAFKYIGPYLGDSLDPAVKTPVTIKENMQPRSLIRHSSFQEICAVAEMEHQKLSQSELTNSAPPFESKFLMKNEILKTKFDEADFRNSSSKFSAIKRSSESVKTLKVPSNMKTKEIHIAKPMVNYTSGGDVNENKIPSQINHHNEPLEKCYHEDLPVASSQTIPLTGLQRDAILQYLEVSLQPHQKATIHLDGSTTEANVIEITDKGDKSSQRDNDSRSRGASCTGSNSPVSMHTLDYSPLSIPSGFVTPVPSASSDVNFMLSADVNDVLEKIEAQNSHAQSNCVKVSWDGKNPSLVFGENVLLQRDKTQGFVEKQESVSCGADHNSQLLTPSCSVNDMGSNDSASPELANILRGKISENTEKQKMFLIDEKTLLSPMKKSYLSSKSQIPVNLAKQPIFVITSPNVGIKNAKTFNFKCTAIVPAARVGNKKV